MKAPKVDLSSASDIAKKYGLAPGGRIQKMLNVQIATSSDRFVPFMQGMLKTSAYPLPASGTYIEWRTPYAQYLWYGKVMVDPITKKAAMFSENYGFWSRPNIQKELSERDLKFSGAPVRGPKWALRAWDTDKDQILANLEKEVGR